MASGITRTGTPIQVAPSPSIAQPRSVELITNEDEDDKIKDDGGNDDDASDSTSLLSNGSPSEEKYSHISPPSRLDKTINVAPERQTAPSTAIEAEDVDDTSDCTSLLSTTTPKESAPERSPELPASTRGAPVPVVRHERRPPFAVTRVVRQERRPPAAVTRVGRQERRPPAAVTREPLVVVPRQDESVVQSLERAVFFGIFLFLCGLLSPEREALYYFFRCSAWVWLAAGLVTYSSRFAHVDVDAWFLENPQRRVCIGGVLAIVSLVPAVQVAPHANLADGVLAIWVAFHGRIARRCSFAPQASGVISLWFTIHHLAESMCFMYAAQNFDTNSRYSEIGYDARLAWIRGSLMCALALVRFWWLEWRSERSRIRDGASGTLSAGTLSSQEVVLSFYGFLATTSFCNATVGAYILQAGNLENGVWLLVIAGCQGIPMLVVALVGQAGLYKLITDWATGQSLIEESAIAENSSRDPAGRLSELGVGFDQSNPGEQASSTQSKQQGFGTTLMLGGVLAGIFIWYYAVLEATCSSADLNEGAGELIITRGGTTIGTRADTRFLAPLFVDASVALAENGTTDGELLWIEDLCDNVLDCSTCPMTFNSRFNASTLRGKILLYSMDLREEIYVCGVNRLGRTFGATGLVGLGSASIDAGQSVPGYSPKRYRRGEVRDAKPRDGDAGIPFAHFHLQQNSFSRVLLSNPEVARAVIRPTVPNSWRSMACGYWKPLATLLILGHVVVVEKSISNLLGHIRISGLRTDLAQLSLATESVAHVLMALFHHDPYLSFHWAVLSYGGTAAFIFGSVLLTCSSTLLLAAFWHQMVANDGLASVACESRTAHVLSYIAIVINFLVFYIVLAEVGAILIKLLEQCVIV